LVFIYSFLVADLIGVSIESANSTS
jgi:hypothetical protein